MTAAGTSSERLKEMADRMEAYARGFRRVAAGTRNEVEAANYREDDAIHTGAATALRALIAVRALLAASAATPVGYDGRKHPELAGYISREKLVAIIGGPDAG